MGRLTDTALRDLARRVAPRLEGYSNSLQSALEKIDAEGADDQMAFCKELDRLVFECQKCGYWHGQIYNAAPDTAEWVCVDCAKEG